MTEQHPITPPLDLVEQWHNDALESDPTKSIAQCIATQAARWGADQELEACCKVLWNDLTCFVADDLRAFRRPNPPSLKEQALEIVRKTPVNSAGLYSYEHVEIIRRALEQLPDQ